MSAPSLARLADELEGVVRALRERDGGPVSAGASRTAPPGRELAMRLYRERRDRDRILAGSGVAMAEPSWDMLLLLYATHDAERPLTVSNISEAGGNAATTGLRHLEALERAGLIARKSDLYDRRRTLIGLSDRGLTLMRLALETVAAGRGEDARIVSGIGAVQRQ